MKGPTRLAFAALGAVMGLMAGAAVAQDPVTIGYSIRKRTPTSCGRHK